MEQSERRTPDFCDESEAYTLFCRGAGFLDEGHPAQAVMYLVARPAAGAGQELHPRDPRPGRVRARTATRRAAELFEEVVADVPDCDYAHYALARCLRLLGRGEEARGHLRLARALHPQCAAYRERLDGVD